MPLLVPIIKADAYGHGSIIVGREALRNTLKLGESVVETSAGVGFATIEETISFIEGVQKVDPNCLTNKFILLMGLSRLLISHYPRSFFMSRFECVCILISDAAKGTEEYVIENRVRATVSSVDSLDRFADAAQRINVPAKLHVKIDTGMNRIGLSAINNDEIDRFLDHFVSFVSSSSHLLSPLFLSFKEEEQWG